MFIVIPGGGIENDKLPSFVETRLKKAYEILKKNPGSKIIFCGKYSFLFTGENIPTKTEAQLGKDYLLSLGVSPGSILMENRSKDTIGNAYYVKKLFFIPRGEKEAIIITSDFHMARTKYIFNKIFGPTYKLTFIETLSGITDQRILERQQKLLKKTKELLARMRDGDHNFLKGKLYKIKYYREKRPNWVKTFVSTGRH